MILRTDAQTSFYSTAEYCAPVWCRSAHTRLINSFVNDALRIVTGCLRLTPTDHLRILSSTHLILGERASPLVEALPLAKRGILDPDHLLHGQLTGSPNVPQKRLKSRRPFVRASRKLLNDLSELGIRLAQWTKYKWSAEYSSSTSSSVFSLLGRVQSLLEWHVQNSLG